jgi:hypothetical protein
MLKYVCSKHILNNVHISFRKNGSSIRSGKDIFEKRCWDIELDCKSVVDKVIGNLTNLVKYDTIIKEFKALLIKLFTKNLG